VEHGDVAIDLADLLLHFFSPLLDAFTRARQIFSCRYALVHATHRTISTLVALRAVVVLDATAAVAGGVGRCASALAQVEGSATRTLMVVVAVQVGPASHVVMDLAWLVRFKGRIMGVLG